MDSNGIKKKKNSAPTKIRFFRVRVPRKIVFIEMDSNGIREKKIPR